MNYKKKYLKYKLKYLNLKKKMKGGEGFFEAVQNLEKKLVIHVPQFVNLRKNLKNLERGVLKYVRPLYALL